MEKVWRWLILESMNPSLVKALSIDMVYNWFMNGVDRFDELRAAQSTEWKEMQVTMLVFTFLFDASIINAYAVYMTMNSSKQVLSLRELKPQIVEELVGQYVFERSQ